MSRRWVRVVLIAALFFFSLWHRANRLGDYPAPHATDDEFHYVWAGISMWETGSPLSWSSLQGSARVMIGKGTWQGSSYTFVNPALDHPPLFSLAAGGFAKLLGVAPLPFSQEDGSIVTVWDVNLAKARWLSLIFYAFSFWLLFDLVRIAFSYRSALMAALFFGLTAHVVGHGRLLLSDNMTSMLLLLNLWAVQRYLLGRMPRATMAVITVTAVAAALLCKLVAASQVPAVIAMLAVAGKRRDVGFPLAGFFLGGVLFLGFNAYAGWDVFTAVMESQAGRFYGFDSLSNMINDSRLVETHELSVPLFAGWFCLLALALRLKSKPLMAAPLAYLFGFLFFAPSTAIYGWYAVPMYPYLCMALGVSIVATLRRPAPVPAIALLLLLLPNGFQVIWSANKEWALPLRLTYVAAAAGLLLSPFAPKVWFEKIVRYLLCLAVFLTLVREYVEIAKAGDEREITMESADYR